MRHNETVILLLLSNVHSLLCIFTATVKTEQGPVRGLRGSAANRYYGIPYARADRFQVPQTPSKWNDTYFAIKRFKACAQMINHIILGSEDCLHLDIYTPNNAKPRDKLPVFVFLHGGAYFFGSKIPFDAEYLVTKNVVAVTVNYRLGVLGFLCLNGISNMGLRDQVAALKWIQKNISQFGGNPNNVILSGQSSGAVTTGMHMFSTTREKLFHKAILFSGDPTTFWAFNLEHRDVAFKDANKIGNANSEKDVYEIFQNASLKNLLTSTQDRVTNSRYFRYTPCLDKKSSDPFFYDTPYNILKSGKFHKVPVIIGNNNEEGIFFLGWLTNDEIINFEENIVNNLPSTISACLNSKLELAESLRKHYFTKHTTYENILTSIARYYSAWTANLGLFARMLRKFSNKPVYNYLFCYEGNRNFAKFLFGRGTRLQGAAHCDDCYYTFKIFGIPLPLSNRDKLLIDRHTTMLTNFMKFGNPTPKRTRLLPLLWPALSADFPQKLVLNDTLSIADASPSEDDQFFLGEQCKHGQSDYVPCEMTSNISYCEEIR